MSSVDITVVAYAEQAARLVAERLAETARSGGHICLTGGSTPKRAYELAARLEPDWGGAALWWGDERCVPPDDERSNYGMAREALLDKLETPPRAVHRMEGELGGAAAAEAYERELHGVRFDLLLLGIGPDAHVASLFPDAPTLAERGRLATVAEPYFEPIVERVSLTLPALCSATAIVFLAAGPSKAGAVRRAFASTPSRAAPASLVRSDSGPTRAVLDEAAASGLSR